MRELTGEEIIAAARGVFEVREGAQGLDLRRFPQSAMDFYESADHYRQCSQCHPGVRLEALTDSGSLTLATAMRLIYPLSLCIDLYVDGVFTGFLRTEEAMEMRYPAGEAFGGTLRWEQTGRPRRVTLYFPHLASLYLRGVQIDDGASWEPLPEEPILLALGDSNTQGGTSAFPSMIYSAVAARTLGLSLHNRGIGGMVFDAASLPERPLTQQPALITVAYGINDWGASRDIAEARSYLARLRALYPDTSITVLAPVFSKAEAEPGDAKKNERGLTLHAYRAALADIVREFPGMRHITTGQLIPPDPGLIFDAVHPSTAGHLCYGLNLAAGVR
ncbi:MAG TPA: SGNH/GDSL hydrolase family protein [Armatimonadota bacterium]|jgi:lysophospholipase L1-like esterase